MGDYDPSNWRCTPEQSEKLLRRAEDAGWPALVIDQCQHFTPGEAAWRKVVGPGLSRVMGEKLWRALHRVMTASASSR